MVNRHKVTTKLFAGIAVLGLFAVSCGSNDEDKGADVETGDGAFAELDLGKVDITIGSKDFTENQLIAEMYAQSIEAGGGKVTRKIDLGGTNVNRDALMAGEIGAYPDYNGTGWTVHLGHDDPGKDPKALFEKTAEEDLEKNQIHWLGTSAFNNTYGFATGPKITEENGGAFDLQGMADYLKDNKDAVACMEQEFPDRPDGLILFKEDTGFDIPGDQRNIMESGIIYNETAKGECAFGEVYTTDGRIPDLDLTVVEDGGAFILYNVSMTLTDEAFNQAPDQLTEIADKLLENLDADTMAELNRQVDVDGKSLAAVAKAHLVEAGLI